MDLQSIEGMTDGDDTNSSETSGDQILRHCARSGLLVRHSPCVFGSFVMVTKVVFSTFIPFVILRNADVFLFASMLNRTSYSSIRFVLRNSLRELEGWRDATSQVVFSPWNCVYHVSVFIACKGNSAWKLTGNTSQICYCGILPVLPLHR